MGIQGRKELSFFGESRVPKMKKDINFVERSVRAKDKDQLKRMN